MTVKPLDGVGSRYLPQRAKATPCEDIQGGEGVLVYSVVQVV